MPVGINLAADRPGRAMDETSPDRVAGGTIFICSVYPHPGLNGRLHVVKSFPEGLVNQLFHLGILGPRQVHADRLRDRKRDSSTTSAILDWANALQDRVDYLVVKNKVAGEDFSYLFESEPGQRFLQLAKPAIIEMERRLPDIQQELNDRGLSLRQALDASAEIAGPVLSKSYNRMRIKGYVNRLEKQFSQVIDVLLPPYEVLAGK